MRRKITPVNGFDRSDKNNARQNNYAWSMTEFNGYLYVGTGRNVAALGLSVYGFHPLYKIQPPKMTNLAEIWRYPIYGGKNAEWERIYTAEPSSQIYGFREMIVYTDINGVEAICCGCVSIDKSRAFILFSTNGKTWSLMDTDMPSGYNSRTFQIFDNVLYCGSNNTLGGEETTLLACTDFYQGFKTVPISSQKGNPSGNIMSMEVLNGQLYIGTALGKGFEVWRSRNPLSGQWTLVVDKGAGDALNEWAMTMCVFKNHLYVGTAVTGGTISVDPNKKYVPFKGFDLIRIDSRDNWKVIVGSDPINPSYPSTGKRSRGKYPSGFGNAFNCYCWQMQVYEGKLFVGTWDAALLYKDVLINEIKHGSLKNLGIDSPEALTAEKIEELLSQSSLTQENYNWLAWFLAVLKSLEKYPEEHGFDLYCSEDGINFCSETLNGFKNPENYGPRTMVNGSNGKLYIGTANVYEGCEVWQYKSSCDCEYC